MSSAADRQRAKAARLAATDRDSNPSQDDLNASREAVIEAARPEQPLPVSTKPIRISLDLATALFDQLTEWRTKAARQLGRGRVTNADVLRVLVRTLLTDEALTARVVTDLRRESGS